MDEVEKLIQQLKDPYNLDKDYTVMQLGDSKDPRAAAALVEALETAEGLLFMQLGRAFENMGGAAVPALIESFGEKSERTQRRIAKTMGRIGDARAAPALVENLDGKSDETLLGFISALGYMRNPVAVPALIGFLDHENEEIRKRARGALDYIGNPAVPALLDMMGSDDTQKQIEAYRILSNIVSLNRTSQRILIPMNMAVICIDDEEIRQTAAQNLLKLGCDSTAIPVLIEGLGYADQKLADKAAETLIRYAKEKDIDLSAVRESLANFADGVKRAGGADDRHARAWIAETYQKIASAASERRQRYMPGELLPAKIKPPKKRGIYRMRRAVNG